MLETAIGLRRSVAARVPPWLRFEGINGRLVLLAMYGAVNLGLAFYFVSFGEQHDWRHWVAVSDAVALGDIYAADPPFVWSPVAAHILVAVVGAGYWAFVTLHLAVVPLLRDRTLIALTLLSWPFWHDVANANTMTFVFVAGAIALRGYRPASLVYLALFLLMPRPVQAPLAVWLLWQQPAIRLPFVAVFLAHAGLVGWSGHALEWFGAMTSYGVGGGGLSNSIGPPRWFGLAWLVVGIPIGAWLTWRGRVGLAGLAVSPYWLPIYLLVALWEVRPRPQED